MTTDRTKGLGGILSQQGYVLIRLPNHPRANQHTGMVFEHIIVAEKKLGRSLNEKEIIHHIDEDRTNNHPDNIYVCSGRGEHGHIHICLRAFKACGQANWRKCPICKQYDDPLNLLYNYRHKGCHRDYERIRYQKKNRRNTD